MRPSRSLKVSADNLLTGSEFFDEAEAEAAAKERVETDEGPGRAAEKKVEAKKKADYHAEKGFEYGDVFSH